MTRRSSIRRWLAPRAHVAMGRGRLQRLAIPLRRLLVRLVACAVFCAGVWGAPPYARADSDVRVKPIEVTWSARAPQVSFTAKPFATGRVRDKLKSGLPQRIVTRVYAFRRGNGRPVALSLQTCKVVYDLWEGVYRVEIERKRHTSQHTLDSLDDVIGTCLRFRRVKVGRAEDYAELSGRAVYFGVLIELNPLSPETLERIRRWLARPGGGGRLEGDAFFGSFVSIFVNRRIGSAEHRDQFRSPPMEVP